MIENSISSISLSKAYEESEVELRNHLPPWSEASTSQKLHLIWLYFLICLPVCILLFVVIGGYCVYVIFYISNLLGDEESRPELYYWHSDIEKDHAKARGLVYLSIETLCISLLLISHFRASFTDPGPVPKTKEWEIPSDENSESSDENNKRLLEKTKKGFIRSCSRCQHKKPDRAHHCRQCDRCNLKMDHHCNWIANCVGYFNYKYFFLMVFYGAIALGLFIGTFWECVVVVLNDDDSGTVFSLFIVMTYSLIVLLGVAVIGFCLFHIWQMANNYTTIEYCEKKRKEVPGYTKSPFDLGGKIKNFKEALGENPLAWFLPVNYREPNGGLYFA